MRKNNSANICSVCNAKTAIKTLKCSKINIFKNIKFIQLKTLPLCVKFPEKVKFSLDFAQKCVFDTEKR